MPVDEIQLFFLNSKLYWPAVLGPPQRTLPEIEPIASTVLCKPTPMVSPQQTDSHETKEKRTGPIFYRVFSCLEPIGG